MEIEPFSLLLMLEEEALRNAFRFPLSRSPEASYKGIGFGIGSYLLVVSIDSVCEVIQCPRLTPIPGTRGWVHGIAAVRGQLLPVVDLFEALGGPSNAAGRKGKVLAVRHSETMIGLLVDEVFGSKHFLAAERFDGIPEQENWLFPFLDGSFVQKEETWNIFSMRAIEEHGLLSRVQG